MTTLVRDELFTWLTSVSPPKEQPDHDVRVAVFRVALPSRSNKHL